MSRLAAMRRSPFLLALFAAIWSAGAASAFEALDGRVQAHGFYEMQLRMLSKNFGEQWDVSQWYHIFDLELEFDFVRDTHGPLDLLSAYVRLEGRFDCIYSRGCGTIRSVDAYGNRSRRLPGRLNRGNEFTGAGQMLISNDGPYANSNRDPLRVGEIPGFAGILENTPEGLGRLERVVLMQCTVGEADCNETVKSWRPGAVPVRFWNADRNRRVGTTAQDQIDASNPDCDSSSGPCAIDDGTSGAPFLLAMSSFADYRFTSIPVIGGSNYGHPARIMGPWLPDNTIEPNGTGGDQPNPMDSSRILPQSLAPGSGSHAMRPIPILREDGSERFQIFVRQESAIEDPNTPLVSPLTSWQTINPLSDDARWHNDRAARSWEAHGLYVPSPNLKRALQEEKFADFDFFDFSETERAFNRGLSQRDEGELKEAYLDIEMFDSRLWMRVGKQTIVWGKTELFRTTDQFNPQDFGLASLPGLEESRIGLWSWRGVYSFYEVGPLEDVRVEAAFNFDQFESADLGACGEPYTINLVCGATFGSWVHGFTGVGVAGVVAPPDPWDSSKGMEFGGRLEFRWKQFTFAFSDFYGYDDFPHVERLTSYNRNVDWRSGRPRYYMHTAEQMQLTASGQGLPCSTPSGPGVIDVDGDGEPDTAAARVEYTGAGNEGCLYPGPTNRDIDENGAPRQIALISPNNKKNGWVDFSGNFINNTTRADAEDSAQRQFYSTPTKPDPNDPNTWFWPKGPNADLCGSVIPSNEPGCGAGQQGARIHDSNPLLADGITPNPNYNPFYDPRFDPAFDPAATKLGFHASPDLQDAQVADRRALQPQVFDPFRVHDVTKRQAATRWANAYDPTLLYDPRNSLDVGAVNLTLFNFICATTVGFNELDSSACAQTVFSSSKPASPKFDTRVSFVISGLLMGDPTFNGLLSDEASDDLQFKGKLLPNNLGIVTVKLDLDVIAPDGGPQILTTYDIRSQWAYSRYAATMGATIPEIESRELESYNCLGENFDVSSNDGPVLCGGLAINTKRSTERFRIRGDTFVAKVFTPEQEALLGCGPYFLSNCDSNGLDLLTAEGSALLQSFIGADSIGLPCSGLGICDLIPKNFGAALTDPASDSWEYRTDGRVIGRNGRLLRVDPITGEPELGSNGFLAEGMRQSFWQAVGGGTSAECDYSNIAGDAFNPGVGADANNPDSALHHRWNSRCWDLRGYFQVKGLQPGTATFEILGLGGPKCTTADIGGPAGAAGVLPGCRNKWATIRYNPSDPNATLDPNNPAAGYNGNNYLDSTLDPANPDPRTDYRQLALSALPKVCSSDPAAPNFDPNCPQDGVDDAACNPLDPDCNAHSPLDGSVPLAARSGLNWGVYSPGQTGCSPDVNDPACYLGGWRQAVDGDPDRLGTDDNNGDLIFPRRVDARGAPDYLSAGIRDLVDAGGLGSRVENGCTAANKWIFIQRTADNRLLAPPECAHLYSGIGAGHPFTGESFSSEMAGLSYNFMNILVAFSDEFGDALASIRGYVNPEAYTSDIFDAEVFPDGERRPQRDPSLRSILDDFPDLAEYERLTGDTIVRLGTFQDGIGSQGGLLNSLQWDYAFTGTENELLANIPQCIDLEVTQRPFGQGTGTGVNDKITGPRRIDCAQGLAGKTLGRERCTFVTPQFCGLVQSVYSIAGQKRNIVRAGGNGTFGRRTMQWQSGGEIFLSFEKRNVLGFSSDFAEDYTKSNWSMEFTWIEGVPRGDSDSYEGFTRTDDFNLTISVDRPTFINFLNPNRTFFLNSQWFFQYRNGYTSGMGGKGPVNVLATLAFFTGYFQDRLNPSMVFVYDFQSVSGAALPEVSYRFSENFSISVGANLFMGSQELVDMPLNGVAPSSPRAGHSAYKDASEPGISLIRDRDEVFMTLRYTF